MPVSDKEKKLIQKAREDCLLQVDMWLAGFFTAWEMPDAMKKHLEGLPDALRTSHTRATDDCQG